MCVHLKVFDKRCAEILAQNVLRDIVFGGTQTAGGEDNIGAGESLIEGHEDMLTVVVNGSDLVQGDAGLVEALCHPGRVGVHHLSYEQLISYGNDFCFHIISPSRFAREILLIISLFQQCSATDYHHSRSVIES